MTSSAQAPAISVPAQFVVQEPVVAQPNRLMLAAGPLPAATNHLVTIRNDGANALALSDAIVNVPGAEVGAQENETGRLFRLAVKFPAGFEPKPDRPAEVPVKTSQPKFAVLRLPVVAAPPRNATAPQTAPTALRAGPKPPVAFKLIPTTAPEFGPGKK